MECPEAIITRSRTLQLVTPDLFDRGGGIARISRSTVLAAQHFCERHGLQLEVRALVDSGLGRNLTYLPEPARYQGYRGRRAALARDVLACAWSAEHRATLFLHVNLATLGLLFPRRSGLRPPSYGVVAHGVEVWHRLPLHRRLALRSSRIVLSVSGYTATKLVEENSARADRVHVVPNCLDPAFESREAAPSGRSAAQNPFLLSVTSLDRGFSYKGVDHTITAFGEIAASFPAASLLIVGNGDDLPRLRELAECTAVSARIQFLQNVDDPTLKRLYRDCTAFVLPSSGEGFGLVYLEAMWAAKPVIAARSGAAPEVVEHGKTGLIVEYGNTTALGAAMSRLLSDPAQARTLGDAGERKRQELYSFAHYSQALAEQLLVLCGIPRASGPQEEVRA
jgi:glycosyltransferase involved in cell wall biosynthesis